MRLVFASFFLCGTNNDYVLKGESSFFFCSKILLNVEARHEEEERETKKRVLLLKSTVFIKKSSSSSSSSSLLLLLSRQKKKKPKSILPSPSDKYTHASNANAVERGASEKTLVRSLDGSRVGARFFSLCARGSLFK